MYKKPRFRPKRNTREHEYDDSEEASILFNIESYSEYENINPGTVTVEGFGLEAWNFEETHHPRENTILVNASDHEGISAKKFLRRINELQHNPGKFGWNPERELADLREFTGKMGYG